MNPDELESRIAACNRELRREWYLFAIFPLAVFFAVVGCLYLKLPAWPVAAIVVITPFLMSIQLTRLVNAASVHTRLVCPHCGTPLGGFIKQARRGVCPNCSAPLFDQPKSEELGSGPLANDTFTVRARSRQRQKALIALSVLCVIGSAVGYWLAFHAISTGVAAVPSFYGPEIAHRTLDPNLFWLSFVAWVVCGTSPLLLIAIVRSRFRKHGAQQFAPADRRPATRDAGG